MPRSKLPEFINIFGAEMSIVERKDLYLGEEKIDGMFIPDKKVILIEKTLKKDMKIQTLIHELGHAMVDLDNQIEFIEGQNILHFEDEEEYVEDFALDFDMFGTVPNEIKELTKQYNNYNV